MHKRIFDELSISNDANKTVAVSCAKVFDELSTAANAI